MKNLSSEARQNMKQWKDILKWWKNKNSQLKTLYGVKMYFKNESKTDYFK